MMPVTQPSSSFIFVFKFFTYTKILEEKTYLYVLKEVTYIYKTEGRWKVVVCKEIHHVYERHEFSINSN